MMPLVYLNPLTYLTAIFRFITLKMENIPISDLIKQGVVFDVHGVMITPLFGLLTTALIGAFFLFLCVRKFEKADFSNVKVARPSRH